MNLSCRDDNKNYARGDQAAFIHINQLMFQSIEEQYGWRRKRL